MEHQGGDLKERCLRFSLDVIRFVSSLKVERAFASLLDQLVRSATSIGANVTEARAASSRRDFVRFYEYALKSGNETIYWLRLILDGLGANKDTVETLTDEVTQISRIIAASVLKLKG